MKLNQLKVSLPAWLKRSHHREVTKIAYKLYKNRLLLGKAGNEIDDWHKAERINKNLLRRYLFKLNQPLIHIEKRLIEPFADYLNRAAIFNILEKGGIIIAVFLFAIEFPERREKSIYEAWTIVNDANKEKSGVVRIALERLHKEGFSLEGIQVEETNLKDIKLKEADLRGANLQQANLVRANFFLELFK